MIEEVLSEDGKEIIVKSSLGTEWRRKKIGGHMHEIIPEGKIGNVEVSYKVATEAEVKSFKMRSIFSDSYAEYYDFEPGTYTRLIVGRDIMMSDTPMEIRTNEEFIRKAHGHVLIGGLGLGVVLLSIQNKPEVKSITVIEFSDEVMELVAKHLPLNEKVKIIKGDILEWLPEKSVKYDTVYFDIWPGICADNYDNMKLLHKRFRKYLNKDNADHWMSSWRYYDVRRLAYENNKFKKYLDARRSAFSEVLK